MVWAFLVLVSVFTWPESTIWVLSRIGFGLIGLFLALMLGAIFVG